MPENDNRSVLGGVVIIDMQVAGRPDLQVDHGVAGKAFQHVIQKTNAGGVGEAPLAVERQRDLDLRLGGPPIDDGLAAWPP